MTTPSIAVVIPAYRVADQILSVLEKIPAHVRWVIVVDDACPEKTHELVAQRVRDPRVQVIRHASNQGVGGAMVSGFKFALEKGADVVVKIDGDGQMDPSILGRFVTPIVEGRADYTKGNRFFQIRGLQRMPTVRVVGNAVLSFLCKVMSGYWSIMDPTNGYVAIHAKVLKALPLDHLSRRYFFESDMLYQLSLLRAVVVDIPMAAVYGSEKSNLRIGQVALEFPPKFLVRSVKRVFYTYFLRDFNLGTVQLLASAVLMVGGLLFGSFHYWKSIVSNIPATSGTVMLAALPIILGFQCLLGALQYDVMAVPRNPIHPEMPNLP